MSEFYINISNDLVAQQIADMLNKYNMLDIYYNSDTILSTNAKYFIEVAFPGKIIACAALYNNNCIKHVCVLPEYRNMNIAKKLIQAVLTNAVRGNIFMTIREDNIPSLRMASSLGFVFNNRIWKKENNHYVIQVVRSI